MRPVKGFALLLCLLLVLMLTIFACAMLLLAQDHYAASKSLHDSENARTICASAAYRLVHLHNSDVPRVFLDPTAWNGNQLKPFGWNGYLIRGTLAEPWNPANLNLFQLQAHRARSYAKLELPLEQIRFEHFSFFSDTQQTLPTSTLFDGLVHVRDGLTLGQTTRFREAVHAQVVPGHFASYRKPNAEHLAFRGLSTTGTLPKGFEITGRDPRFWKGTHYELDLDHLSLTATGSGWQLRYRGTLLGDVPSLVLTFDDTVITSQSYAPLSYLPSGKQEAPVYIRSTRDVVLGTSVQRMEQSQQHPLLFEAANTITIAPALSAIRIEAALIGRGEVSMQVVPGVDRIRAAEEEWWKSEIHASIFVIEPEKREELLQALNSGRKLVWFRGSVGLQGSMQIAPEVALMHFQASRSLYPLLGSFPFIRIIEGRERWL